MDRISLDFTFAFREFSRFFEISLFENRFGPRPIPDTYFLDLVSCYVTIKRYQSIISMYIVGIFGEKEKDHLLGLGTGTRVVLSADNCPDNK